MEYLDCDKTLIITLINNLRKKIKELEKENNTLENNKILQIKLIDNLTISKMTLEKTIVKLEKKNSELVVKNNILNKVIENYEI